MSGLILKEWYPLFLTALVVLFRVFILVKMFWNQPLNHGPGFFFNVEVAPGFYNGEGVRWLKRYRTTLLAEHLIEAFTLVATLAFGRWNLLMRWGPCGAVLLITTLFGFLAYTRAILGANTPVRSSAVVSLETRRLGDYISWRAEVLMGVIIALSWALLLTHRNMQMQWNAPVESTYVVVGLLLFKISAARRSFPLPTERPEEHHRWVEAQRRFGLWVMDWFRWISIVFFAGYALQHGWPGASRIVWLPWLVRGVGIAFCLVFVDTVIRGSRRLAAMGRDLHPIGSWSTPFRPAGLMGPGIAPFAAWFGGLLLLMVFFRR